MRRDTARARAAQSDPADDLTPSGKTVLQERLTTYGLVTFAVAVTRSDLYSLGAVAYMLLTGTPVFNGMTAVEVYANHIYTEPEGLSARLGRELPADLERLVLACLAKQPEHRPASASALRMALDGCADAKSWDPERAEGWWREHTQAVAERRHSLGRTRSSLGRSVLVDRSRHDAQAAISDTVLALEGQGARLEP